MRQSKCSRIAEILLFVIPVFTPAATVGDLVLLLKQNLLLKQQQLGGSRRRDFQQDGGYSREHVLCAVLCFLMTILLELVLSN